jgi:hypothetical protein
MSTPPIVAPPRLPTPANDNRKSGKPLRAVMRFPPVLPVQRVEVEVFAALLDDLKALVANDNGDGPG